MEPPPSTPLLGAVAVPERRRTSGFVPGLFLLSVCSVSVFFLSHRTATPEQTVEATLTTSTHKFSSASWGLTKMTHVMAAGGLNSTWSFFTKYLAPSLTDCPSDLGCDARRLKFGVKFGSGDGALQFVEATKFNDVDIDGTQSVEWWVHYWRELHGDMQTFDAFMHNKVQLYTENLTAYAEPLMKDNIPMMVRRSKDADGANVMHLGVQVQGVVFELVGPTSSMPLLAESAVPWSEEECPAASSLPLTLAFLKSTAETISDDDDYEVIEGVKPLIAVTLGITNAEPNGVGALTRYSHLSQLTGAVVTTTFDDGACTVVDVTWSDVSSPYLRYVNNDRARVGVATLQDYDSSVAATHAAFISGGRSGSWDRYLDQHVGLWFSGNKTDCNRRGDALRELLSTSSTPFAERQQTDAHLMYTGYDGPFAIEYQFESCSLGKPDAASECGCDSKNNEDIWYDETGDSCWSEGDDWCL